MSGPPESYHNLVYVVGRGGGLLYANHPPPGVTAETLTDISWLDRVAAGDREMARHALEEVFATGRATTLECGGAPPDDPQSWYQCRLTPNEREGIVVSANIVQHDITRWKQREEGLRAEVRRLSEQLRGVEKPADGRPLQETTRFRAILDAAGEAIFIVEPFGGRLIDVNATACRWLGQTREQLLTKRCDDLDVGFPILDPDHENAHVVETRDSMRPKVLTGVHRRGNGSTFPVEVAVGRHRLGSEEFCLTVVRDAAQRQRTEEALAETERRYRESERKFQAVFELARDAIYLTARDGTIAEANPAMTRLLGYDTTDVIGMEARKLYAHADAIRAFQRGVEAQGMVRDMEVEVVGHDGRHHSALLTATYHRNGRGTPIGYQCLLHVTGLVRETNPERITQATAAPLGREEHAPRPSAHAYPPPFAPRTMDEPPLTDADGAPLPGATILVVGPDTDAAAAAQEASKRLGAAVVTAPTLEDGVATVRQRSDEIDVVFLRLTPEELEESTIVGDLRRSDPNVQIVLLCADAEPATIEGAHRKGVAVLPDPGNPTAFADQIRHALSRRDGHSVASRRISGDQPRQS